MKTLLIQKKVQNLSKLFSRFFVVIKLSYFVPSRRNLKIQFTFKRGLSVEFSVNREFERENKFFVSSSDGELVYLSATNDPKQLI